MKRADAAAPTRCDSPAARGARRLAGASDATQSHATVFCTLPSVQARASTPSGLLAALLAAPLATAMRSFTGVSLENRLLLCLALATFAYCSCQCLPTGDHNTHAVRAPIAAAANAAASAAVQLSPNSLASLTSPAAVAPSALTPPPQSPVTPSTAPGLADTAVLLQVQAVRALISGHRQEALAAYQQLAAANPDAPEYRAAAAILSKKIAPLAKPERGP